MKNESVAISYCINIPEGATNGDAFKIMFPNLEIIGSLCIPEKKIVVKLYPEDSTHDFDLEWWNAPYKAESEEVRTCANCKHYKHFGKEFPCIDCMMDCKDRFEESEDKK